MGCSFDVDHIEAALVHLEHHDVTCVAVSRATLAEIDAFQQRMGWRIPWVSSFGSDFNVIESESNEAVHLCSAIFLPGCSARGA